MALGAGTCAAPRRYAGQPATSPTLRLAIPSHLRSFALRDGGTFYGAQFAALVYEGLTGIDDSGRVRPALARSWEMDASGRVYTFRLRGDARFQDGTRVLAGDVVRSWMRAFRTAGSDENTPWMLDHIAGADAFAARRADSLAGVLALDDSTLRVTLKQPLAPFPAMLALPQAAVSAAASDEQHPIGSGPWRWVRGLPSDDDVWLARWDGYWGERPRLDSLVLRFVPDSLSARALEAGAVDYSIEATMHDPASLAAREDLGFLSSEPIGLKRILINLRSPALTDVRVRRALCLALDVPAMQQALTEEQDVRASGAIPPGWSGADPDLQPYAYQPERARRLLAEARVPSDRVLQLWYSSEGEDRGDDRLAVLAAQYFGAVGLRVEVHATRDPEAKLLSGEADLVVRGWYPDYRDADAYLYPMFSARAAGTWSNAGAFSDSIAERLIEASRAERDPARRAELLSEANARIADQAANIFLWFTRSTAAYSLRLTNVPVAPFTPRFISTALASRASR